MRMPMEGVDGEKELELPSLLTDGTCFDGGGMGATDIVAYRLILTKGIEKLVESGEGILGAV